MTNEIKRRTILDLTPDDVSNTYTDSTFNEATSNLGTITGQDTSTFGTNTTFHPGSGGARTSPNESGYAYSDTPEATVFIQKRQWVEDDWTYVTNSKERSGKIQELLLRIRMGNIITRKLDWLNDHEVFTKVSKLNSLLTSNALDLSGSQVTRYYTENLDLSQTTTTTIEEKNEKVESLSIATQIQVSTVDSGLGGRLLIRTEPSRNAPIITAVHGPNTGGKNKVIKINTTGKGSTSPTKIQNVINGPNSVNMNKLALDYPESVKSNSQVLQKYPSAEWWEIDLASINPDDFYPDRTRDIILKQFPKKDTAPIAELRDYIRKAIQGGFNKGKGYVARVPEGRTPPRQLATSVGEPIEEAVISQSGPPIKKTSSQTVSRVYPNVFNGVIELANVMSISTTISNMGSPGSAQLTLQNPSNILTISDDDIDIALGENPFLDSKPDEFGSDPQDIVATNEFTGLKTRFRYYRGRYYTDRAYQLVTRQDLGAIGNFTNSADIEELKTAITSLKQGIQELQQFASSGRLTPTTWQFLLASKLEEIASTKNEAVLAASKKAPWIPINISKAFVISSESASSNDQPLGTYVRYNEVAPQVRKKISTLSNLILTTQQQINTLINAGTLVAKSTDTAQEALIRNQIKKYFQNRTIFQTLDRVFIWLTSPARTEHLLENGTPVAEEFTVGGNKVRRIQDIVSLIQQLDNVIQSALSLASTTGSFEPITIFTNADQMLINQQLYDEGNSSRLTAIFKDVDKIFSNKLPPLVSVFKTSIEQKVKELATATASEKKATSLPASTDTSVQGVDPSKLFTPNSYAGLTDRQFQVFQGVITRISRSFSNGVFTVRLDCADNLYFLQRARYINVPGLNAYSNRAQAVLDDPIWRQRDAFMTKTLTLAGKDVPVESYFGKWKSGQLTLTASFLGAKEGLEAAADAGQKKETTSTANVHTPDVVSRAFGRLPQSENEPFDGADPANIISVLTCGVPFDLSMYLENVLFKGSLAVQPKMQSTPQTPHSGEALYVGPFEQVRQEVSPLTKKYGSFQPYLLAETPVTQADKLASNTATKINLAIAIMQFYKNYIAARKSVLAADITKDQQKTNTPGSPFKQITNNNVDQIIADADFPASSEQITLGQFRGQIDRKVLFIILSAIRQTESARLNKAFNAGAFAPEEFKVGSEDFSSVYKEAPNRAIFALTSKETGLYSDIVRAASDRVSRGAVFKILLDKEQPKKNYSTPQSPSLEQLVGANASNPSVQSLKGQRDAKLHPTNILQATKESIIYKVKPNFLVVSDKYFTNTQLVDYVRQIGNPGGAFNDNQYATVLDRCTKSAKTIDWEFYADTQGHLQFKPPTYNRTLLHHLINFNDVDAKYIKLLAETLIRFKALDSLKAIPLARYKQVFTSIKQTAKDTVSNQLQKFTGLALKNTTKDVLSLAKAKHFSKGRYSEIAALVDSPSETTIAIQPQANSKKSKIESDLDPTKISTALKELMTGVQAGSAPSTFPEKSGDLANSIISEAIDEFDKARQIYIALKQVSDSDNDKLAKAAADVIEVVVNLATQAQKNLNLINEEIAKIEKDVDAVIKFYVDPNKIHVITSAILISEDWEEAEPSFTRLNISSAFAYTANQTDSPGGQFMHWAGSVDYDLWRMYGYKVENLQVPFLQKAEQVAVYGDMLMARQYAEILKGTITVRGDSKYQLGDCVYIEDENLYYYITGINHQFAYGQAFSTTLTLAYGRRPGYYIPYPFDVLGSLYTRGANLLYTGAGGDKITSAVDINNLLDIAWQKDLEQRKKPETNN